MKLSLRQEKILVFLISLYLFCIGIHRGGNQLVIADISDVFHTGTLGVGILTSLQHVPPLFAPLLLGILADKIGKKPVVVGSVLLFAVGCVVCGFSSTLTMFIIGTIIFSIGSCVSESVSTAVLSDLNAQKSMQYINMSQFMFSFGAVVGPLLIHFFETKAAIDWRFPFSVGTLTFVVMAVLLLLASFPEKLSISSAPEASSSSDTAAVYEHKKNTAGSISRNAFIILFAVLFICQFIYCGIESSYGSFIGSLMDAKYSDSSINALALSAFWGGMALSRLIFAMVSYKVGFMMRLSFALSAIMTALLVIMNNGLLSIGISAAIGFAYGPIWSTIGAVAAAKSKGRSGTVIGALTLAGGVGGITFPMLLGTIAGRISIGAGVMMLAIVCAIAAVLCVKVPNEDALSS